MKEEHAIPEFGYRDEAFGGSGEHDPVRVCTYELEELGNVDVPMTLLARHAARLTSDEARMLREIVRDPTSPHDIDAYARIIEKVCDGRDFCVWLCLTPRDYFEAYVDPFDDDDAMRRDRIASVHMTKYAVPADAIVLSDDPTEGLLLAWKADGRNTEPIAKVSFADVTTTFAAQAQEERA